MKFFRVPLEAAKTALSLTGSKMQLLGCPAFVEEALRPLQGSAWSDNEFGLSCERRPWSLNCLSKHLGLSKIQYFNYPLLS